MAVLTWIIGLGLAVVIGLLLLVRYRRLHGVRVITCPETEQPAAVWIRAWRAVITSIFGRPDFRLQDCSRWPERRDCGQACLSQIAAAPEECLIRTILTRWYAGRSCALCGKDLTETDWLHHRPAAMTAERVTFEWSEIAPEKIPQALGSCFPVCWNCHIAEQFRRQFPDLITDRPWPPGTSHRAM